MTSKDASFNGLGWRWAFGLAALLVVVLSPTRASAQFCGPANILAFSVSSMNAGTYNPGGSAGSLLVTLSVTTNQSCSLRASFIRTSLPPVMTSGASTLDYTVRQIGGGATYITATSPAPAANTVTMSVTGGAGTRTQQVEMLVPANQWVSDGSYTDGAVVVRLYSSILSFGFVVATRTVTPQVTVPRVCRLDPPSTPVISFVPAEIPQGVPNPAIVKSTTLGASCTSPTYLRLTGSALTGTPAIPPASGFDHFINYRAVGSFGAASTTLVTTTSPATAASAVRNVASGPTLSGTVNVSVNLETGQTVSAGAYSGVLTVTIDPSL